jgi:hypothetical protein
MHVLNPNTFRSEVYLNYNSSNDSEYSYNLYHFLLFT